MKIAAEWTDDAQGKKDFDGAILGISTRYWPSTGGFSTFSREEGFNNAPVNVKPSAKSDIVLWHDDGDGYTDLVSKEFEGDTFEEVAAEVEAWAQEQMDRIVALLKTEFEITTKHQS